MRAKTAARIRFGILTARDRLTPDRLTFHQTSFLIHRDCDGWMIGDRGTVEAHDREYARISDELWAAVKAKAAQHDTTASEIIRALLTEWVKKP